MSNIIASDFYRVRRGAALRNTFIAILGIIVLVMVLILVFQSDAYSSLTTAPEGMTAAEVSEFQADMAASRAEMAHINGGASFGLEILGQFIVPFFFLPIAIAVFCADFTAGTYRNTLSYESRRGRVYLAKLALSAGLCLAMVLGMLAVSWLLGSIAFGTGGFGAAYFSRIGVTLLLQLPIYLAFVAVCHCLVAFTKKSSATIAIFLVGYLALTITLQTVTMAFPALDWLLMLDPQSSGKMMAMYDMVPLGNILFVLGYNLGITAAATALGMAHFCRADMP